MKKTAYVFIVLVSSVLWNLEAAIAQPYTLTVTKSGNGTVTSSPAGIDCGTDCTEIYSAGKKVTLKAKADPDSYFAGWSDPVCGTAKNCSLIMNADIDVTATFQRKTPRISVSANSLDFGVMELDQKATQVLTISNTGTGDLHATIAIQGDYFSFSGRNTLTIKPNKKYDLKVTCRPTSESLSSPMSGSASEESSQTLQGGITINSDAEDFPVLDISVEARVPLVPLVDKYLVLDGYFSIKTTSEHGDQCDWTISFDGAVNTAFGSQYPTTWYANDGTFEMDVTCVEEDGDSMTMNGTGRLYLEVRGQSDRKNKTIQFEDSVEIQEVEFHRCFYFVDPPQTICDTVTVPPEYPDPGYDNTHKMCYQSGCEDKWEIDKTVGAGGNTVTIKGHWWWYVR